MASRIRVLHVEDDPAFAELTATQLESLDDRFAVDAVETADAAFDHLEGDGYDCVLSDYDMPGTDGLELLDEIRSTDPDLPFILYTGQGSEQVASEAISLGVTDYIQKDAGSPHLQLLANRIVNAAEAYRNAQRAEALQRVRDVIRDINQALVRSDTLSELDEAVCSAISAAEPYEFAWIGEHDPEARTVRPRASAGIGEGYLETIEITTDEAATAGGPTGRAIRTRELAVMQNIPDDPAYEPWREEALERGYRSSAAVPLVHGDRLYGVLNVYADRTHAFDADERTLLVELGDDIAHAMCRIDREKELELFELAAEHSGHAIYLTDPDGTITYVNPAFERITGWSAGEAIGRNPRILNSGEMPDSYFERLWETLLAGEVWVEEVVNRRRSGERYDAEQTIAPVQDETGEIVAFVAIQTDISERKAREREIERTKERFEVLVEHTHDIISVLDESGTIRYESPAVERVLGYDQDELLGDGVFEYVHPEDRDAIVERFADLMDKPESATDRLEFRFLDADDEWVWLEAIGSNRRQTVVEGFVVTSRDITDRLERERQIERERNRFEAAFETVPEPAVHFVYDDETPIVNQVNHAFEEVFGYDRATAVGKPVDDLVVPVDDREQARDLNREVRESGHLQETVHRVTPSGERPFLFTARTMPTTDDDLEGVATYVDLTEQKRREEALIRQNERLDRFAGIVSHDLRNPLNVAEGHLELAREGGEPGEHLEVVADALDRMTALIDDLLTLARHGEEVGEMEAVALDELATACWGTVESEGADLAVQVERSVYADRTRLRQLLENLLANAITHGGDDVTITIGALEDGFYVEDDGPGIPPEERESVFEAGYSTGDEGTGFGLAIVREIATAHGWAIQVTEGAAGGARFEVTGVRFADGS